MNVSFGSTVFGTKADNKGSCMKLAFYLEKENEGKGENEKRHFFSHSSDKVSVEEVIKSIDANKRKLGKKDSKYFLLNISPSQKELRFISKGQEEKFLMAYTRNLMNKYAENFRKGLQGEDLMYFAKFEENRYDKKTKEPKPGLNFHVHVIISRRDLQQRYKLSPETNHINSKKGVIKGGFNRNNFRQTSQELFDQMTGYSRKVEDSFNFQNEARKQRVADWLENKREAEAKDKEAVNKTPDFNTSSPEAPSMLWNLLLPTVDQDSFYEFDEEEMIRKKKKKRDIGR